MPGVSSKAGASTGTTHSGVLRRSVREKLRLATIILLAGVRGEDVDAVARMQIAWRVHDVCNTQ
jgi:hypothetical protein